MGDYCVTQGQLRNHISIAKAACRRLRKFWRREELPEELPVVLHVHDEIVGEVSSDEADEALQRLVDIMIDPPQWAEGFPIGVEGFVSPRYVKSPFNNCLTLSPAWPTRAEAVQALEVALRKAGEL